MRADSQVLHPLPIDQGTHPPAFPTPPPPPKGCSHAGVHFVDEEEGWQAGQTPPNIPFLPYFTCPLAPFLTSSHLQGRPHAGVYFGDEEEGWQAGQAPHGRGS